MRSPAPSLQDAIHLKPSPSRQRPRPYFAHENCDPRRLRTSRNIARACFPERRSRSRRVEPPPSSKRPWRVVAWNARTLGDWTAELEAADAVINLAGKNVNCRYTPDNRRTILQSRVDATHIIGEAIARTEQPPRVFGFRQAPRPFTRIATMRTTTRRQASSAARNRTLPKPGVSASMWRKHGNALLKKLIRCGTRAKSCFAPP